MIKLHQITAIPLAHQCQQPLQCTHITHITRVHQSSGTQLRMAHCDVKARSHLKCAKDLPNHPNTLQWNWVLPQRQRPVVDAQKLFDVSQYFWSPPMAMIPKWCFPRHLRASACSLKCQVHYLLNHKQFLRVLGLLVLTVSISINTIFG